MTEEDAAAEEGAAEEDATTEEGMTEEDAAAEEGAAEEGDSAALAMPGEGVTVSPGRATWDTGWFQTAIFNTLLTELGYEVEDPTTVDNPAFYLSAATGDLDFWANGWFPQHTIFLDEENVQGQVERVGSQVEAGALQGYLVDKTTADELGITSLEDFKKPEVIEAFDSDGNGQANLVGCNPGWGCELIIEHHLDAYELRDTVEHVQGEYSLLIADTISRYESGEPVLFYTWTPNWTIAELALGEDVVWIEVPFSSLPEEQIDMEELTVGEGIAGCVSDPCNMGFPPNDIQVVANNTFLEENPAARALFEEVKIPLEDIAAQNILLSIEGENTEDDIERHASEWIEANRDMVDGWLEAARAAAE